MIKSFTYLLGVLGCVLTLNAQTYVNPILHADYSDPDVCRVGDDYYMTASSFNCVPGLPILHSRDLVHWELVSHALPRLVPEDVFSRPQHGKGVWAPSIRLHGDSLYIYWGDPDYGIYMVKAASNDVKSWSAPLLVKAGKGLIDPCPLWDDDGRVYLVHAYAGSRARINSVLTICELDATGSRQIDKGRIVFDGNHTNNHTVEGAKLYKRDGYYYILAPAGGVEYGWQLALRSKSIYGEYEYKTVLEQGNTKVNGPHQGGLVDTPTGEEWFVHFQDKGAYGRIVHLQPVEWRGGFPMMGVSRGGKQQPAVEYRMPKVGVGAKSYSAVSRWQWHANPQEWWCLPTSDKDFRLYTVPVEEDYKSLWDVGALLLQKFPNEEFTATCRLQFVGNNDGEQVGLVIMGRDYSYIAVRKQGDDYVFVQNSVLNADEGAIESRNNTVLHKVAIEYQATPYPPKPYELYLRVRVAKGGVCSFSYSLDGVKFTLAPDSFTARVGKWIGAKVGLFAQHFTGTGNLGYADVKDFTIQ